MRCKVQQLLADQKNPSRYRKRSLIRNNKQNARLDATPTSLKFCEEKPESGKKIAHIRMVRVWYFKYNTYTYSYNGIRPILVRRRT